jgi:hypothetical protein
MCCSGALTRPCRGGRNGKSCNRHSPRPKHKSGPLALQSLARSSMMNQSRLDTLVNK